MGIHFGSGELEEIKWVTFDMGNGSILRDTGVSSVTRHSSGRHQIVFDGNMSSSEEYALIEPMITKTGKSPYNGEEITVTQSINTPHYMDPLSESYWSK